MAAPYFPPTSRWGRPGFAELVSEIARVWKADRTRVDEAAAELTDRLVAVTSGARAETDVADTDALDATVEQFQMSFDRRHGGFGGAPKFPRPSELLLLLREHARRGAAEAPLLMVTATLRAMAVGGMRDHVGGGFHRYSVDAEWRVPHFEKMLYDQAQLVIAYLEAGQATGDEFYSTVAEDTLQYVLRDMTSPLGGFYSAEDADSIPPEQAGAPNAHKSEGAFYIWSDDEIGRLLGADADVARNRFGILKDGNAPSDPQGEFTGRNLLYVAQTIEEVSTRSNLAVNDVIASLGRVRRLLFEARSARPRPHLDDKVLTAWNGLMIAAFARAARVLPDSADSERYRSAAEKAARFLRDHLWIPETGTLLRRYRDGDAAIQGYAEDYAYLVWGLLELFQATGQAEWLQWAMALQARQDALFWDEADGGWFSTTGQDPTVLLRLKEDYDGAEPAASSIAALNALTLAHLTGDAAYRQKAERTLARYGKRAGAAGRVIPMMLCALSAWHSPSMQIVVVGRRESDAGTDARARERGPLPPVRRARARRSECDAGGASRRAAVCRRDESPRRRSGLRVPGIRLPAACRHRRGASRGAGVSDPVTVLLSEDRARAAFTLFHEKGNIVTARMVEALRAALDGLSSEPALKLITLEGRGPDFSFGASIPEHAPDRIGNVLPLMHLLVEDLLQAPAVTAAVVRGRCLGGGFELALACDFIFAAEDAVFGLPEVSLGVFPPAASALLPLRVGASRATRAIVTGAPAAASEWLGAGLLEAVVPGAQLAGVGGPLVLHAPVRQVSGSAASRCAGGARGACRAREAVAPGT